MKSICVHSELKNYKKADDIFTKIHQASSSQMKTHRISKKSGEYIKYFYEYENGNTLSLICENAILIKEMDKYNINIYVTEDEVTIDEDKINYWKIHQ